jgi:Flp pilus assembly protein TadD
MPADRLETLKAIVAQNPSHTFARYGLAMEYANTGNLEQAVLEFQSVMQTDPNYGAAYYHCGRTLERLGRTDEARATFQKGIEVTGRTGDSHTRNELQAALDLLV